MSPDTAQTALKALRTQHLQAEAELERNRDNLERARELERAALQLIEGWNRTLLELDEAIADVERDDYLEHGEQ